MKQRVTDIDQTLPIGPCGSSEDETCDFIQGGACFIGSGCVFLTSDFEVELSESESLEVREDGASWAETVAE